MMKFGNWIALAFVACLGISSIAYAQNATPSGKVQIASTSVSLGIGVNWGDGKLQFQGKSYAFSINGLTVLDLGIASITTVGEVYNLKNVQDLDGNYAAGAAGIAIAGGADDVIMKNDKGVVLHLHGVEKGVRLQLGAQGVTIKLKS